MENYSPLRYPGGKSALYPAIANIIESNNMKHCIYIEPFAGGANIAWSLLINGIVDYIIINDADKIFPFFCYITFHVGATKERSLYILILLITKKASAYI